MDNILNRIIAIEHNAQEMIENAQKQKKEILDKAEADCAEIKKGILAKQQKRLDEILAKERQSADERIKTMKEQNAAKLDILTSLYNEKKDVWVRDIYRNIIGRCAE